MKFSLIIGTLNRKEALESCLSSIMYQTNQDFEVIIIDQSDNTETEQYVRSLKNIKILYKHVEYKGLSRARNDALALASGEYFCLMDDDAYYKSDYLDVANKWLSPRTVLSGYIFDTIKQSDFVNYKKKYNGYELTLRMITRLCPSAGLVLPMSLVKDVGLFDESFGVGSKYGAGEETDLLLRGFRNGYKVKYIQNLELRHPVPIPKKNLCVENQSIKMADYYEGLGALYKKHMILTGMRDYRVLYYEVIIKFQINDWSAES